MGGLDESSLAARELPFRSALLALAAVLMGMSLHLRDGLYSPPSVLIMAIALLVCMVAVLAPRMGTLALRPAELFIGGLGLIQIVALRLKVAGATANTVAAASQLPFHLGLLAALLLAALVLLGRRRMASLAFVLLLATHAGIGIWKIRTAPSPKMDVYLFQHDAGAALLDGHNPYTLTFPNIHGRDDIYAPGSVKDGRIQFGYPYPPLSLLLTAPVQWIMGDFRYAMLLGVLATGAMIAMLAGGRIGMLLAILLLFTPRCFYIIEIGWTEPLCALLLVAALLALRRSLLLAAVVMGLLLASKQYIPFILLLLPLLIERRGMIGRVTRLMIIAIVVALVVSLPLALWDFSAFWKSAVTLQLHQPYRADSTSFLAWWGQDRPGWVGPFWLAFVMLGVGIVLSYVQPRRGTAALAQAFALCLFLFLAFNKQAFANYYFLVIAALCAAAAVELGCSGSDQSTDKAKAAAAGAAPASLPA
jgi:hypothetical protein